MSDLPFDLDQLIRFVDRPDWGPLQLLTDAVIMSGRIAELGDGLTDHFVQRAREAGASWSDIGSSMGVSKQAAQKRFVSERRVELRQSKRGLFTRFDESGRHAVQAAVGEAQLSKSIEINTIHLVMGLADPESGRSAAAISDLASSSEEVVEIARRSLDDPRRPRKVKHLPFTDDCKKVLELSLREAIRARSRHIGSEHILLGLLREKESDGARLLPGLGVTYEAVATWLTENALT